jgi:hypothetical protein
MELPGRKFVLFWVMEAVDFLAPVFFTGLRNARYGPSEKLLYNVYRDI